MSEVAGSPSPAPSWWARAWVAFGLYVLATLALTFPLVLRLRTHVPAGTGDLWQNLWNLWWWRHALFELGRSPFETSYQFHPDGVALAFHSHSPLNMLVGLPLEAVLGLEGAYNSLLLLGFALAGFGTWLLLRDLRVDPRAAFLGGLVYAFAPMHLEQSLEHLNLASIQFVPFCVLTLRRLVRDGGLTNVVAAGLAFAANALVCWQYGALLAPIAVAVVVREAIAAPRGGKQLGLELASAAGLASLIVLPFAWPLLQEFASLGGLPPKRLVHRGTDLAFWLLPSDHNPLLGGLTRDLYASRRAYPNAGFLTYLGVVPVALSIWAVLWSRVGGERRGFFGAWLGVFLLLSLGAHPVVLGQAFPGLPLPHDLIDDLPGPFRVANRFGLLAMLGLAVLTASALSDLFRRGRVPLAWLLGVAVGLEYLWLPYPLQPAVRHPVLAEIASDDGAVLPIPFPTQARFSEALYDQTRHGRPIVGGYVSYRPAAALTAIESSPLLSSIAGRDPFVRVDPDELRALGIGTVLVHLDRRVERRVRADGEPDAPGGSSPDPFLQAVAAELERVLGAPSFADEQLLVFGVAED